MTAVTTDFGGKLRDARERRGISLRQIAASTKISVSALAALERNDVSRLPGGIFSRALVRSYAVEVGLDPETTVHEFLQRFQETPGLDHPAGDVAASESGDVDRQKKLAAGVFMLALAGMLLMAAAVGVVVYQMRPSDLANPAAIAEGAAPLPPATAAPETVTAPSPAPARATPAVKSGELRLELHPTAPCWASVAVGGKRIFSKLIAPGERETVVVADAADLTVGDAGGCVFSINGRPARPLGRSGQVRTARISSRTIDQYFN